MSKINNIIHFVSNLGSKIKVFSYKAIQLFSLLGLPHAYAASDIVESIDFDEQAKADIAVQYCQELFSGDYTLSVEQCLDMRRYYDSSRINFGVNSSLIPFLIPEISYYNPLTQKWFFDNQIDLSSFIKSANLEAISAKIEKDSRKFFANGEKFSEVWVDGMNWAFALNSSIRVDQLAPQLLFLSKSDTKDSKIAELLKKVQSSSKYASTPSDEISESMLPEARELYLNLKAKDKDKQSYAKAVLSHDVNKSFSDFIKAQAGDSFNDLVKGSFEEIENNPLASPAVIINKNMSPFFSAFKEYLKLLKIKQDTGKQEETKEKLFEAQDLIQADTIRHVYMLLATDEANLANASIESMPPAETCMDFISDVINAADNKALLKIIDNVKGRNDNQKIVNIERRIKSAVDHLKQIDRRTDFGNFVINPAIMNVIGNKSQLGLTDEDLESVALSYIKQKTILERDYVASFARMLKINLAGNFLDVLYSPLPSPSFVSKNFTKDIKKECTTVQKYADKVFENSDKTSKIFSKFENTLSVLDDPKLKSRLGEIYASEEDEGQYEKDLFNFKYIVGLQDLSELKDFEQHKKAVVDYVEANFDQIKEISPLARSLEGSDSKEYQDCLMMLSQGWASIVDNQKDNFFDRFGRNLLKSYNDSQYQERLFQIDYENFALKLFRRMIGAKDSDLNQKIKDLVELRYASMTSFRDELAQSMIKSFDGNKDDQQKANRKNYQYIEEQINLLNQIKNNESFVPQTYDDLNKILENNDLLNSYYKGLKGKFIQNRSRTNTNTSKVRTPLVRVKEKVEKMMEFDFKPLVIEDLDRECPEIGYKVIYSDEPLSDFYERHDLDYIAAMTHADRMTSSILEKAKQQQDQQDQQQQQQQDQQDQQQQDQQDQQQQDQQSTISRFAEGFQQQAQQGLEQVKQVWSSMMQKVKKKDEPQDQQDQQQQQQQDQQDQQQQSEQELITLFEAQQDGDVASAQDVLSTMSMGIDHYQLRRIRAAFTRLYVKKRGRRLTSLSQEEIDSLIEETRDELGLVIQNLNINNQMLRKICVAGLTLYFGSPNQVTEVSYIDEKGNLRSRSLDTSSITPVQQDGNAQLLSIIGPERFAASPIEYSNSQVQVKGISQVAALSSEEVRRLLTYSGDDPAYSARMRQKAYNKLIRHMTPDEANDFLDSVDRNKINLGSAGVANLEGEVRGKSFKLATRGIGGVEFARKIEFTNKGTVDYSKARAVAAIGGNIYVEGFDSPGSFGGEIGCSSEIIESIEDDRLSGEINLNLTVKYQAGVGLSASNLSSLGSARTQAEKEAKNLSAASVVTAAQEPVMQFGGYAVPESVCLDTAQTISRKDFVDELKDICVKSDQSLELTQEEQDRVIRYNKFVENLLDKGVINCTLIDEPVGNFRGIKQYIKTVSRIEEAAIMMDSSHLSPMDNHRDNMLRDCKTDFYNFDRTLDESCKEILQNGLGFTAEETARGLTNSRAVNSCLQRLEKVLATLDVSSGNISDYLSLLAMEDVVYDYAMSQGKRVKEAKTISQKVVDLLKRYLKGETLSRSLKKAIDDVAQIPVSSLVADQIKKAARLRDTIKQTVDSEKYQEYSLFFEFIFDPLGINIGVSNTTAKTEAIFNLVDKYLFARTPLDNYPSQEGNNSLRSVIKNEAMKSFSTALFEAGYKYMSEDGYALANARCDILADKIVKGIKSAKFFKNGEFAGLVEQITGAIILQGYGNSPLIFEDSDGSMVFSEEFMKEINKQVVYSIIVMNQGEEGLANDFQELLTSSIDYVSEVPTSKATVVLQSYPEYRNSISETAKNNLEALKKNIEERRIKFEKITSSFTEFEKIAQENFGINPIGAFDLDIPYSTPEGAFNNVIGTGWGFYAEKEAFNIFSVKSIIEKLIDQFGELLSDPQQFINELFEECKSIAITMKIIAERSFPSTENALYNLTAGIGLSCVNLLCYVFGTRPSVIPHISALTFPPLLVNNISYYLNTLNTEIFIRSRPDYREIGSSTVTFIFGTTVGYLRPLATSGYLFIELGKLFFRI